MSTENSGYYPPGQDLRFVIPTLAEEQELFRKAKGGCVASKEFIVRNHLLFAQMQANRLVKSGQLPRDEVTSAANFAVMKAYEGFDYTKGFRFSTYLRHFIKGEISSLWRTKFVGGVPVPSLAGGFSCPFSGEPGKKDGLDASGDFGSHSRDLGKLDLSEEHPGEQLDLQRFNREQLAKALTKLTAKEQELVRQIYIQDMSPTDVARGRGVKRQAVHATHARILKKLRGLLPASVEVLT